MKKLIIYFNQKISLGQDEEKMSLEQLSSLARSGSIRKKMFSYHSVTLKCDSLETLGQPFLVAAACRLLTLGRCFFCDEEGKRLDISLLRLLILFNKFIKEQITAPKYCKKVQKRIEALFLSNTGNRLDGGSALFLRCDLPYYYYAGGSIGHIAGVVNNLEFCTGHPVVMVSSRKIPTVREGVKFYEIDSEVRYKNVGDIMSIAFNKNIEKALDKIFQKENICFIYQRSALNAFAGVECAIKRKIPFVLEYNGSEIWIAKNWGNRNIKGLEISEKIERLTFEKANLITCVSTPLKQQLVDIGIDEKKIIVTPNGVNPDMYHPDIDGSGIRKQYQIEKQKTVIGFIGTFGAWHGAEVLASAYAKLRKRFKDIHLLMIGDGVKMGEVRDIIKKNNLEKTSTLTGIVPQEDGASYLAACDILVSPTLRNPDGTPFFGSPTKLFEYMAMGKGIVASNIDQMAEILKNENNALLVEPNNVDALCNAIERLIKDENLRKRLGENARREVCLKYTWRIHTQKIVDTLKDIMMNNTNGE